MSAAKTNAEKETADNQVNDSAASTTSSAKASSHRSYSGSTNRGDMNTAQTGKIVGNRNSKIYHVPGQAGYRMNSSNAVYFDSEAEAQAAGYRKSLR